MNILFLTLEYYNSYHESDMYADVMLEFIARGHQVHTISPIEEKKNSKTYMVREGDSTILRLAVDSTRSSNNLIKKGISTLAIGNRFIRAIKDYYRNTKFDLILYSTPPITFVNAIEYIKKRDQAISYLMLKDIFPQNAVDLGMMGDNGIKRLIWQCFRGIEKRLYKTSDYIGCMSKANVKYLIEHNDNIKELRVNVCPNSLRIKDVSDPIDKLGFRKAIGIPENTIVFIYGGNLGKPQGIPFFMECLKRLKDDKRVYFLVIGSGTEYDSFKAATQHYKNTKLIPYLPVDEYDKYVRCSDIGLIFLDFRFTIPNFPSRLLSYTAASLPVLCATDPNSDIGEIVTQNNFGWFCESNNVEKFCSIVYEIVDDPYIHEKGDNGYKYHKKHFLPEHSYRAIIEAIEKNESSPN